MSNNLNAPVLNVKLIKWSLNRINIIKHCTLIYIILMFLWDNVRDTYQIQLIIANIIVMKLIDTGRRRREPANI